MGRAAEAEGGMMCSGQAAKHAVDCQHWISLSSRLYATRHEEYTITLN